MASGCPRRPPRPRFPSRSSRGRRILPFPDGTFDAAVSAFVLCSVEDRTAVLAEVRRVLKPGGKLVLLEHVRGEGRTAAGSAASRPSTASSAGNCHLDRDTKTTVGCGRLRRTGVEPTHLPGTHPLVRPGLQGVAIKTSS